jgi:hypothetical protein
MRYLVLFISFFCFWAMAFGLSTIASDPMRKTLFADYSHAIPGMGQNAQDVLDMKLALFLHAPKSKIILGNSRPYKGLPAEYLGEDWFNFAVPGANVADFNALLEFLLSCTAAGPIDDVVIAMDLSVYDVSRGNQDGRNFDITKHRGKCTAENLVARFVADLHAHGAYFIDPKNIWRALRGGEKRFTMQGSYLDYPERLTAKQVRNTSLSKLDDYLSQGWGVQGISASDRDGAQFDGALPAIDSMTRLLAEENIAYQIVWTPVHASLLQVKHFKGLDTTYDDLQRKTAGFAFKHKGRLLYIAQSAQTSMPLDQPSSDGFYFIEPSHFTSVYGRLLAYKINLNDLSLDSVEKLEAAQSRDAAYVRSVQGLELLNQVMMERSAHKVD